MSGLEEYHWVFYGRLAEPTEMPILHALIDGLVERIEMTPFGERQEGVAADGTMSLLQPIAESHIAAHARDRRARVDVFSCTRYPIDTVLDEIEAHMPGEWVMERIRRGLTPPGAPAHLTPAEAAL